MLGLSCIGPATVTLIVNRDIFKLLITAKTEPGTFTRDERVIIWLVDGAAELGKLNPLALPGDKCLVFDLPETLGLFNIRSLDTIFDLETGKWKFTKVSPDMLNDTIASDEALWHEPFPGIVPLPGEEAITLPDLGEEIGQVIDVIDLDNL